MTSMREDDRLCNYPVYKSGGHIINCRRPAAVISPEKKGKCIDHFLINIDWYVDGGYIMIECSEDCNMMKGHKGACTYLDL